jgi:oligopeptide/dipeptide ABC transporter ATP-binding protein
MTATPLVELDQLVVRLPVEGEHLAVLRGVDLSIGVGEAVGLVGESGSGKSMTARAIDRLLPSDAIVEGTVRFDGSDVWSLGGDALRRFRTDVAMVFQDPRTHINPVRRIGDFMIEAVLAHGLMGKRAATAHAIELLDAVRIDRGAARMRQYPHELSGGMLQRVMIASALMARPRLLLADEPTTALDVTTQAEVMAIIDDLRHDFGLAMLFITHDLELATAVCDRTAVMYAGQVMEVGPSEVVEGQPQHPYTVALLGARPSITVARARLDAIPGQPLSAYAAPMAACSFAPRCAHAVDACRTAMPPLVALGSQSARCVRVGSLDRIVRHD